MCLYRFVLCQKKKRDGPYQFQNNWIPPGAIDIMSNFVFICFFFKIRSTYILLMVNQFQNCYNEFVIISLDLTVSHVSHVKLSCKRAGTHLTTSLPVEFQLHNQTSSIITVTFCFHFGGNIAYMYTHDIFH